MGCRGRHLLGESPFALSGAVSAAVEGFQAGQLLSRFKIVWDFDSRDLDLRQD